MQQLCPISDKQVNEMMSRINSVLTVIILVLFFQYQTIGLLFLLGVDLLMRGFFNPQHSVFNSLSEYLMKSLRKEGRMINAGPKIFAAQVGFFFTVGVLLSYLFGFYVLADVFAFFFLFCALLEGFFGYCVACKMYPIFRSKK